MELTQQQRYIVQNMKDQEKMCVQKYEKGETMAKDPVLKQLFASIRQEEQQHYDSLEQLLNGTVPRVDTKDKAGEEYHPQAYYTGNCNQTDKENDQFLCTDAITTEKYVSMAYDYELFQFADPDIRRLFNDIETEEQNHAEKIYKYKTVNSMI